MIFGHPMHSRLPEGKEQGLECRTGIPAPFYGALFYTL